jgi:integrase
MDPRTLLEDWLTTGTLRPSTQVAYRQEVGSWLTWCAEKTVDPYHFGIEHVAAWADERYLRPYLGTRPFDGPEALAFLAAEHPEAAKSHDRRITALTQYYTEAAARRIIRAAPDLTMLRSGVDRDAGSPKRLTASERTAFLIAVGGWGPNNSRNHLRDRLIAYLLLEGLRPGQIVRLDIRHLYEVPLPNGSATYDVRAPDDHENVGKQYTLDQVTAAAIKEYLPKRRKPADGVHCLIIGEGGNGVVSEYPNKIVQQIAATSPVLAQRTPPVTADVLAHTGFWDTPPEG